MDLDSSTPADPGHVSAAADLARSVQAADVRYAYRVLLGREAESEEAVSDKVGMSRGQLILQFITSVEFEDKVVRPVLDRKSPDGPVFDTGPDAKVLAWAANFFPLSPAGRRAAAKAPNWVALFESIFGDPQAAAAFASQGAHFTPSRFADQLSELRRGLGSRRILGGLDEASGLLVRGWALDTTALDAPVGVELWLDGAFAGATLATEFRRDLQDRFAGPGAHGFVFQGFTPPGELSERPVRIEVRESASKTVLGVASVRYRPDQNADRLTELSVEVRAARAALERIERSLQEMRGAFGFTTQAYDEYRRAYYAATPSDAEAERQEAAEFSKTPIVNLVLVVRRRELGAIEASLKSLKEQSYRRFNVLLASDDGGGVENALEEARDAGVTVSAPDLSNPSVLAAALDGDYALILDAGDRLSHDALHKFVQAVQSGEPLIVYADSDRVMSERGLQTFAEPELRPDFDEDLLLQTPFLGDLLLAAVPPLKAVIAAGESLSRRDRGRLALALLAAAPKGGVTHIHRVLHHRGGDGWRPETGYVEAVAAFLKTSRPGAQALAHSDPVGSGLADRARVIWPLEDGVSAGVIIPTRDRLDLLGPCLASILASRGSNRARLEIMVVDNASVSAATRRFLNALELSGEIRLVDFDAPFNWSAINNHAARLLKTDVLIFLNNDTVVLTEDWADELCRQALRPEVGAVGARLLYEDRTIQHAGIVLGVGPSKVAHEGAGAPPEDKGYLERRSLVHQAAAVTGACLATRADLFARLGGFDEDRLAVEANDIDYCLRLRKAGLRVLYDPYCTLYHFESKSRGQTGGDPERLRRAESELQTLRRRWGEDLETDPFYNRHFDRASRPFTRLGPPPTGRGAISGG